MQAHSCSGAWSKMMWANRTGFQMQPGKTFKARQSLRLEAMGRSASESGEAVAPLTCDRIWILHPALVLQTLARHTPRVVPNFALPYFSSAQLFYIHSINSRGCLTSKQVLKNILSSEDKKSKSNTSKRFIRISAWILIASTYENVNINMK